MKIKELELRLWETYQGDTCPDNCWCRGIRVAKLGRGRKPIVVFEGQIRKEISEMLVKEHNEWLILSKKGKK